VLAAQGGHAKRQRQALPLQPSALNLIDARTHRVVERVGFGTRVNVGDTWSDVAVSGRPGWVLLGARQRLLRIAPATKKVTRVLKLPFSPGTHLLTALGSVWVTQDRGSGLLRVDERTGQIARRFGIPWRAGGGFLTSSQLPDAQAAYEGLNTMLPAFLAGANYIEHAAGWLESGLVACYEKFIVDIEMLRMLQEEFKPLEVDEESLAYGAHQEVGRGGHFLSAVHTLERFRDCFYRPLLSSTENYERWERKGAQDAAARAAGIWRETIDGYEQPPLDDGVRARLDEFFTRRRAELGD